MSANPDKMTRERIIAIADEVRRLQHDLRMTVLSQDSDREALEIIKEIEHVLKRKPRRTR